MVDIDLAKFFDRVHHDRLMSRLGTRVSDKRVLKLIGRFLRSGVMIGGLCEPTEEGTPQGGPLSPLLSNIVLDELDKELERRGLHFVRFADDCVIYVKSKRAGDRVMESISRFITRKLKLKVNEAKSSVTQPGYTKYLGFGFTISKTNPRIRIHSKSLKRFRSECVRSPPANAGSVSGDSGPQRVHPGMVGLLLALRDALHASDTQRVGHSPPASLPVETVEAAQDQTAGTARPRTPRLAGQTAGRDPQGPWHISANGYSGQSIANPILHPYTRSSSPRIT